jgi:hypothetical protein
MIARIERHALWTAELERLGGSNTASLARRAAPLYEEPAGGARAGFLGYLPAWGSS